MPKINRIRVANVVYDNKHITDEIYDSFGGENILLNLANGSGKSVLVQMILQPVIPCARIHGRKIEDYLSSASSPTYICIEWKLDNTLQPTYFLTGIVMSVSGSNDESTSRVKFFTFSNYYTAANAYDISNLPFIEHKENGVVYHSYDSALKEIRQARDTASKISYYVRDEMDRYKKDLAEYGILRDEWEIIKKINEKEGGVDELFASCKTSDNLIDKWILKTISESISNGGEDLFEMFVALMGAILEQEENIRQKELLDDFRTEIAAYIQKLSDLCGQLSTAEKIEQTLAGLYDFLTDKIAEMEDRQEQLNNRDSELQEQLRHIQHEELSEKLYEKLGAWEKSCEKAETATAVLQEKKQTSLLAKKEKEIQEAAQQYAILADARDRISALQEKLKRLETSDTSEESINLEYSLRIRYDEVIAECTQQLDNAENVITQLKKQQVEITESLLTARTDSEGCARLSGRLQGNIDAFLKTETAVFKELDLYVSRMLTNNLDTAEVEAAKTGLLSEQAQHQANMTELRRKSEENDQHLEANSQEQANCGQALRDTSVQLESIKRELEIYMTEEDRLKAALSQCKIGLENCFDKDMNAITLNEQKRTLMERLSSISVYLNKQREFLRSIRNGSVHTDPAFAEILAKSEIEFITGDNYLKSCEKALQDKLISRNPLLPYCYLISKKDIDRVVKLSVTDEIGSVCPIFAFEDLESDLSPSDKIISCPNPPVRLACFYNKRSFYADTKDSYEATLQREIADSEEEERHCNIDLQQLNRNTEIILQFPYEKGTLERLKKEQAHLEEEQARLNHESLRLKAEENSLRSENSNIVKLLNQTEQSLERSISRIQRFENYLLENDLYIATINEKRHNDAQIEALKKQINSSEQQLDAIREALRDKTSVKNKLQDDVSKFRISASKLPVHEEGSLLPGSLTILEEQYKDLLNKASRDKAFILEKIDRASKDNSKAAQVLRKLYSHLEEQEYSTVVYDEDLYDRIREKSDIALAEFDVAQRLSIEAEAERNTALTLYTDRVNELHSFGYKEPLPLDEIKGNYPSRREAIRQTRSSIKMQLDQNEKSIRQYNIDSTDIRRTIAVDTITRVELTPRPNWEALSISDLSRQFSDSRNSCSQLYRDTERTFRQIKQVFAGKHPIIVSFLEVASPENRGLTFNECYYVYERTTDANDRLTDYLKVIENALETIEKDKTHIVQHAVLHGKKLYSEMKRISASSFVKLPEKKIPQQMLRIELPEDSDGAVEDRMRDHINQCIQVLRQDRDEENETPSIHKRVATMLSDRQLLNIIVNKDTLPVKLYKVDINPNNSRLKPWENVVVENSGGEMFVSCFILISALIAYTRGKVMEQSGDDSHPGTKTFIIDNPFGKTSSRHLLEAMIEIANKFNTQMICLSDLSQSSITGQFTLIYQLSVRPSLYSSKSYLKTDAVTTNAPVFRNDKLEHIYFKSDQISLF